MRVIVDSREQAPFPFRGPRYEGVTAELRTYSPRTIALYHRATMERLRKGESEAEQNLLHQVRQYGFGDIESAEKHFSARR